MARAERVLVWGAGGHGRVVADVVRAAGHEVVGWVDRAAGIADARLEPPVVVPESSLPESVRGGALPLGATAIALGIGDNRARAEAMRRLDDRAPAFVHPSATVSPSASVGAGSVIMPGAVVNANATIGRGVVVNTAAVVEHDCVLGDGAHVSPNATLAGGARVGERGWVGAGAVILQNVRVGDDAVVGAGAVVTRDVRDRDTVVGVPARSRSQSRG